MGVLWAVFRCRFQFLLLFLLLSCSSATEVVTIDVHAAKDLINSGYRYLDVRTVEEFKKGHADVENILNIPYLFTTPEGRLKNPEFLEQVQSACSKEDHLVVGCLGGVRSLAAASVLVNADFKDVKDMGGGEAMRHEWKLDLQSPNQKKKRSDWMLHCKARPLPMH